LVRGTHPTLCHFLFGNEMSIIMYALFVVIVTAAKELRFQKNDLIFAG
jgi:hypothetical protein